MSFKAAAWAIETERVQNAHQRVVLIILADCHNAETARCDPSIEYLAKKAMISRRSVERAIQGLEEVGLLTRQQRSTRDGLKTSNRYILHISDASDSRIDASHSRNRCVTQTGCDASHSRINQETLNQEVNQGERLPSKIPPEDFKPRDLDLRQIRTRRPDLHIPTVVDLFKATEYQYPRSDWDRAFFKFALTQREQQGVPRGTARVSFEESKHPAIVAERERRGLTKIGDM